MRCELQLLYLVLRPAQQRMRAVLGSIQSVSQRCGCDSWHEVSRTKIGGAFTGAFGIQGLWWCRVTSYYTVEKENVGGCSPNRFVCDTDTVTFFCCSYEPEEGDCCNYTNPQDISHSDYCGGDICP
jgi:hypothetical protein